MTRKNSLELANELSADLANFQKIKAVITDASLRLSAREPDTFELYALGGILHDLYHGMESICYRVVKNVDQQRLESGSWHRELIEAISQPLPNVRPAVIRAATAQQLQEYRGFRHRLRHMYSFDLDWAKMKPLFENAISMMEAFTADIEQFIAFLRMLADTDESIN